MSRTLFWYIFKDLIKIFLVASGVLTGIMTFGGLLKPLTEHGLDPGQVAKMLTFFWPAMSTYSLPVAALFATTMVYGRLGADNEITACRAAGVSALSIATPAVVLGGIVTLTSFVFLFFVVPKFSLKVEQVIYSNIAQLVQNQIERNHRIEMAQPGGAPLTIFAQRAIVLPDDPQHPREQRVRLTAPVFVRYEQTDKDKNRVPVPADFYMARTATAFISQDDSTGDLYLRAQLDGGMKLPRRTRGTKEDALQVSVDSTSFYPDPIESPVRENTKFMEWHRLRELLANPEKSKRMKKQLGEFIRSDQREAYLRHIAESLNSRDKHFAFDTGAETYVLERGDATVEVRGDKLFIGSLESTTQPSDQLLPRFRQVNRNEGLDATARQISLRATPILATGKNGLPERWLAIEVELADATVKSGQTITPRSRFLRPFSVRMPAELIDFQNKRVDDYRHGGATASGYNPATDRVMALQRNWLKLTNSIKSEIHARASFSVACWVLVLVGCGLGMMFRSGNFLSAFAISVIPAGLCILLIITGQHTCESVPWDIRNFNNPLEFGIYMIWTGNVVVAILAAVLLGRLQRQ
ncbi:hypothetical protein BH09PLA1_BH09PLA1_30120 [soil metagenome]